MTKLLLSLIYVGGIIGLVWFTAFVIKDIFKRKPKTKGENGEKVNTNYFGE